ncbi:tripartite tricarboxylate transporter TctB family protein [Paraburkholderia sp. ZP32-5]|uniref:tripartite tricarboxylate transporter TctB family protein n=1 Tax=Paraburkholderia sp. ZP32-5 TaxID=2883245 RepID=UPI001F1D84D3|nr:tripartite tricarboxylate transporter TctB family protein [Paraburkholderia sp. ZP32-5]
MGVIGLVFVIQFGLAMSYPADPRLFPLIVAAIGVRLAIATQIRGREKKPPRAPEPIAPRRLALALIVPPLYGVVLWALGFWMATILAIPALSLLLGYRRYFLILLVTLGMALAVGLLFPVVNITVPQPALFAH